jgi:succinate-acetate transporter protein
MAILSLIFMIVAIRTNVVFFLIFTLLVPTFCLLAATFWQTFDSPQVAADCQKAAGALAFVVALLGWYILFSIMLALVDFPFQLPIGDLSSVVKGASQKAQMRSAKDE